MLSGDISRKGAKAQSVILLLLALAPLRETIIPLFKIWNLHSLNLPLPSKIQEYMANHKATKKDVRQANKRRDRNRYYGKTTRNAIRDFKEIKTKKEAGIKLPEIESDIDKLAKRGVIHKNKAANLKSKLARRTNALAK